MKKDPKTILDMLGKQNKAFGVSDWKTISTKSEPSGHTLVCLVDDNALAAIKGAKCKAFLGLWRVNIAIAAAKDHAKGDANKPTAQ